MKAPEPQVCPKPPSGWLPKAQPKAYRATEIQRNRRKATSIKGTRAIGPTIRIEPGTSVEVRYELPWHQAAARHLRLLEPERLLELLQRSNAFAGLATRALQVQASGTEFVPLIVSQSGLRYSAAESDYYDTPKLDFFRRDPSVAQRSKIKFRGRQPQSLEISALTENGPEVGGLETKGNIVHKMKGPTTEQVANLEADFQRGRSTWAGPSAKEVELEASRYLYQRAKSQGFLPEEGLQLRSVLHLRAQGYSQVLERPQTRDLELKLTQARAALHKSGGAQALAVLNAFQEQPARDGTAASIEARKAWALALSKQLRTLGFEQAGDALTALWFVEAEAFYFPKAQFQGAERGLKLYQMVDPAYWQGLPVESRHPEHRAPKEAIEHASIDLEVQASGGVSAHMKRLGALEEAVDERLIGAIMRLLDERFGLGRTPASGYLRVFEKLLQREPQTLRAKMPELKAEDWQRLRQSAAWEMATLQSPPPDPEQKMMLDGARFVYAQLQRALHQDASLISAQAQRDLNAQLGTNAQIIDSHASPRERFLQKKT